MPPQVSCYFKDKTINIILRLDKGRDLLFNLWEAIIGFRANGRRVKVKSLSGKGLVKRIVLRPVEVENQENLQFPDGDRFF